MTSIVIVGRLTEAPTLRFTGSGKAVASFTVAENQRKKDAAGNWTDGTPTFWDCTVWEQTAENLAEADLSKGDRVIVTGDTFTDTFTRKDGTEGKALRVKASEVGLSLRGFPAAQQPQRSSSGKATDDPWGSNHSDQPPF